MARATRASVLLFVLAGLAAAGAPRADGPDAVAQRVRAAFRKAWKARSAPPAERAKAARELYRDAWLGGLRCSVEPAHPVRGRVPEGATAEDILAGKYGEMPTTELWLATNQICLDLFLEQHPTVFPVMVRAIREPQEGSRTALSLIIPLRNRLLTKGTARRPDGTVGLEDRERGILEAMHATLFPVLRDRYLSAREENAPLADLLAQGLRGLDDPRAIPVLLGERADAGVREHYQSLRGLQSARKAHTRLVELLSRPDREVRWRAAYALADSRDPDLQPHVLRLLHDPEPKVREQALHMAYSMPSKADDPLHAARRALLRGNHLAVRMTCVRLFAEERDPVCGSTLLELLRDPSLNDAQRSNVVQSVQALAGSTFGYDVSSRASGPTTENNRAAIAKFEKWVKTVSPLGIRPLPWPDGLTPTGFVMPVRLTRLSRKACEVILANAKLLQAARSKNVKLATAREACGYLNHSLNMACPPDWLTVYRRKGESPVYIFSGGTTAYPVRDFSRGVVVSQSGQIAGYTLPRNERRPRPRPRP